jgi:hypothetical protein
MSKNNERRKWDRQGKVDAIIDVLKYIISQPADVGQRCVEQDAFARGLFENPEIGNVTVPAGVRVVFLPIGEKAKGEKGSIILEMPPVGAATCVPNEYLLYPEAPTRRRSWDNYGKTFAIADVLSHLAKHPKLRERCVKDDPYTMSLFHSNKIGRIDAPPNIKTVFLPTGDDLNNEFGSVILELPKPGVQFVESSDLMQYYVCCYHLWLG